MARSGTQSVPESVGRDAGRLDPVELSAKMLALGVTHFKVDGVEATFAPDAVAMAIDAKRPAPPPVESVVAQRAREKKHKAALANGVAEELRSA